MTEDEIFLEPFARGTFFCEDEKERQNAGFSEPKRRPNNQESRKNPIWEDEIFRKQPLRPRNAREKKNSIQSTIRSYMGAPKAPPFFGFGRDLAGPVRQENI